MSGKFDQTFDHKNVFSYFFLIKGVNTQCDCNWIKQLMACCKSDGSKCFKQCCGTIGCGGGGCCRSYS